MRTLTSKHWVAKVDRGVALLDAKYPRWYLNFTVDSIATLNVNDPHACVLHAVTGDEFVEAYNALTGKHPIFATSEGFHVESSNLADLELVNNLWRKVIMNKIRRHSSKGWRLSPFFL